MVPERKHPREGRDSMGGPDDDYRVYDLSEYRRFLSYLYVSETR